MGKIKYLVIASAVLAAVAATPLVISYNIDGEIEKNKTFLEKNGFKQELTNKQGYLQSTRDFTLEVVDAVKVRDYLLDMLVAKNEQYKLFAQSMKEIDPSEMNGAFNGLKFRGQIKHSNLLPEDSTISLIWDRLPHTLNNKEVNTIFAPLLSRGVIALDITLDTRQKVKNVSARDIKEKIKIEDILLDIDTSGHTLALSEDAGKVKGRVGVGKQNLQARSEAFILSSMMDNFAYDFTFKDDLNNQGSLSLAKYRFELAEIENQIELSFANLKATSMVEEKSDKLQLKADYAFDNIVFTNGVDDFKLQNFLANFTLNGLNGARIKKLQKAYNAYMLGSGTPSDEELINDFIGFVNDGVKLNLTVGIKGLSGIAEIKDILVDTTLELPKNNYNDKESPFGLVGLLDLNTKVKIHKDDRVTLEAKELTVPEDFALGIPVGDYFVYEITMKQGAISLNGKPVE